MKALDCLKGMIAATTASTIIAYVACANDSSYYAYGNQMVPLLQSQISVNNELLHITLKDSKNAEIDVYYDFYNPGPETTILMGFETCTPYQYDDLDLCKSGNEFISGFSISQNGQSLPFDCALVNSDNMVDTKGNIQKLDLKKYRICDGGILPRNNNGVNSLDDEYHSAVYAYYFKATFKHGLNKLHHHYTYKMANSVERPYILDYRLTPAVRWANNQIDDFTLEIAAEDGVWNFAIAGNPFGDVLPTISGHGACRKLDTIPYHYGDKGCLQITLSDGVASFHIKNFKPTQELTLCSSTPTAYWRNAYGPSYEGDGYRTDELKELIRECGYETAMSMTMCSFDKHNIHPDMCRILLNMPYAARGHVFKDKGLAEFFTSQWWYKPDPSGQIERDRPLNYTEHVMIKALQELIADKKAGLD